MSRIIEEKAGAEPGQAQLSYGQDEFSLNGLGFDFRAKVS